MRPLSRPLRSSVVRVIAAFAPLAGCADEPGLISNPPNYPPTCVDAPGCVPPLQAIDSGLARDAAREGGDGALDARDTSCPTSQPADDAPCALAADKVCEYGSCGGMPTGEARCKGGRWEVLISTCNPPFLPCPDAEPTPDTACERGWGPPLCTYGECDGGAAATFTCEDARWQVTRHCPASDACPAQQPADQSPCSSPGARCEYGDCYGYPTVLADCVTNSWRVAQLSCNPPPPDACPTLAPREGTFCQHVGTSCGYEQPLSVERADCVNGSWRITTSAKDAGL
jgi:hypothetical protein